MFPQRAVSFQNKVAFITGAGSGIGAATARLLHARGASVVLVDVSGGERDLAANLGTRALAVHADVTDRIALDEAVEKCLSRFGGIDLVFANAGIACDPPTTTRVMNVETFERIIAVDLLGVTRTVQSCLPHVIERQGYILMTASTYAFANGVANTPYATAKAGVEMFGRSLGAELAPLGTTVGVLYPGWISTPMTDNVLNGDPVTAELVEVGFPSFLRQPITPEVVAKAAVDGMGRRAPRIFAPRRWQLFSLLRGVLNPITDRWLSRNGRIQELIGKLEQRSQE